MGVFLDTNVLASAFAARGICEDILREVITLHLPVSSRTVLTELERVLKEKLSVPEQVCREVLEFLGSNVVLASDSGRLNLPLSDEADITILSEAAATKADVFVTGDNEVAALGRVEGMLILSPRKFWELLQV